MKYLYSFLIILVGFLLVKYSDWITKNFGYIDFAEHYFSTYGGTRLLWKLIGILFIVSAFLIISGLMNNILLTIFTPLVGKNV